MPTINSLTGRPTVVLPRNEPYVANTSVGIEGNKLVLLAQINDGNTRKRAGIDLDGRERPWGLIPKNDHPASPADYARVDFADGWIAYEESRGDANITGDPSNPPGRDFYRATREINEQQVNAIRAAGGIYMGFEVNGRDSVTGETVSDVMTNEGDMTPLVGT